MTRDAAHRRATLCWAHLGTAFTRIRRKSTPDRFEVGYWDKQLVVLGAGPTWEIAFDRALGRQAPSGTSGAKTAETPSHEATTQRVPREKAMQDIRAFLHHEGIGSFELAEDGENNWAFWPTSQPHTTSYYHADGSIEWYGQGR